MPEEYAEGLVRIHREYCRILERARALDFDMLLLLTIWLFEDHPMVLSGESHCSDLSSVSGDFLTLLSPTFAPVAGLRRRWKHVLVDEWQDINLAQYRLVQLLANGLAPGLGADAAEQESDSRADALNVAAAKKVTTYSSVYVVGDEDQRIYGWRGAVVDVVRNFFNDFKNCQIFALEPNFRCTKVSANGRDAENTSCFYVCC